MEWEVPREPPDDWSPPARRALARFWKARIARQKEMDDSIARHAKNELLYDKPVVDKSKVRVAGPFTVESLAPHRTVAVEEAAVLPQAAEERAGYGEAARIAGLESGAPAALESGAPAALESGAPAPADFTRIVLDNLQAAGVQQSDRKDRIEFSSLAPWPGEFLTAEGRYSRGKQQRRAGIFIGPEFGTVGRPDLATAAREAAEAGFDDLISCAFAYDAQASEMRKLGRVRVLKARMNADLHMGDELKKTGKGNLFVIFGEPDIEVEPVGDDRIRVRLRGVDVFRPQTGEIRSDNPGDIPCWFVDSDYDGESFFVRHAYFPGTTNDPYKALKTTLKNEVDREAWESLRRTVSRPFPNPASGRIAVKVINHLGDEVMKVLRV